LALKGISIPGLDGIVDTDVERSIENLSYLTRVGMRNIDDSIINIMTDIPDYLDQNFPN